MNKMWREVNNRKLKVCAAVLLLGTIMSYIMDASYNDWTTFTIWIVGLYFGGNVGDKVAYTISSKKPPVKDSQKQDQPS